MNRNRPELSSVTSSHLVEVSRNKSQPLSLLAGMRPRTGKKPDIKGRIECYGYGFGLIISLSDLESRGYKSPWSIPHFKSQTLKNPLFNGINQGFRTDSCEGDKGDTRTTQGRLLATRTGIYPYFMGKIRSLGVIGDDISLSMGAQDIHGISSKPSGIDMGLLDGTGSQSKLGGMGKGWSGLKSKSVKTNEIDKGWSRLNGMGKGLWNRIPIPLSQLTKSICNSNQQDERFLFPNKRIFPPSRQRILAQIWGSYPLISGDSFLIIPNRIDEWGWELGRAGIWRPTSRDEVKTSSSETTHKLLGFPCRFGNLSLSHVASGQRGDHDRPGSTQSPVPPYPLMDKYFMNDGIGNEGWGRNSLTGGGCGSGGAGVSKSPQNFKNSSLEESQKLEKTGNFKNSGPEESKKMEISPDIKGFPTDPQPEISNILGSKVPNRTHSESENVVKLEDIIRMNELLGSHFADSARYSVIYGINRGKSEYLRELIWKRAEKGERIWVV